VSYLNAGIGKLTEQIYVALEEVRRARRLTQQVSRNYAHDPERLLGAVSAMNHSVSFASGLVKAWEIVTGEIWGEAAWRPATTRT
jgi:hypothetical protein